MTAKYHGPKCPSNIHHGLMERIRQDRRPGTEWVCRKCYRRLYLNSDGRKVSAPR